MEGPGGFGGVGLGRDRKGHMCGCCDQASAPAGLALHQSQARSLMIRTSGHRCESALTDDKAFSV